MGNRLTIKQEKYAQGLFAGLTQREAYKQAYHAEFMTDKTIDEEACKLVNSPKLATRIEELTNEFKLRNMITVESVLTEYGKIAFSDITDFLSFKTEKIIDGHDDKGRPVYSYRQIVDALSSDEVDGALISEVSIGKDGTFRFKLHDKQHALDQIGKSLGMFTERIEVSGGPMVAANINVANLSDDDLRKMEEMMSKCITGPIEDI